MLYNEIIFINNKNLIFFLYIYIFLIYIYIYIIINLRNKIIVKF